MENNFSSSDIPKALCENKGIFMDSKERKTGFIIVAAVILLSVLRFGLMYVSDSFPDISDQITYGKGIRLINRGDYEAAESFFDDLFYKDWEKYGDACKLSYYAKYLQYKGKDIAKESYYINKASSYYHGLLADEMLAEKSAVDARCKEYIKAQKAEFNEDPGKYSDTIPFVGMNAQYIDRTRLGTHCDVKKIERRNAEDYDKYVYSFGTVYGDLLLMKVTVTDYVSECVVTGATKYNELYLWKGDIPNVVASEYKDVKKPGTSSKPNYSGNYGGYEYNDFEDFYYNHEEDFDSLDDAEDYYNEYYDDFE